MLKHSDSANVCNQQSFIGLLSGSVRPLVRPHFGRRTSGTCWRSRQLFLTVTCWTSVSQYACLLWSPRRTIPGVTPRKLPWMYLQIASSPQPVTATNNGRRSYSSVNFPRLMKLSMTVLMWKRSPCSELVSRRDLLTSLGPGGAAKRHIRLRKITIFPRGGSEMKKWCKLLLAGNV